MDFAKSSALILLIIIFSACSESKSLANNSFPLGEASFIKRPKGSAYADQGFYEYLPPSYSSRLASGSPLIIFFHGLGENGNGSEGSLDLVLKNAIPNLIRNEEWPEDRPFVVLVPQQQYGCPTAIQIRKFIEFALANYNVNPNQVYLTGISCGGMGIASYLSAYGGDLITAVVPVAGNMMPAWNAKRCSIANDVPIWTLTGEQDPNFNADRQAMQNFIACPQPRKDIRFTSFPNTGHSSWDQAYEQDIYTWMLSHSK